MKEMTLKAKVENMGIAAEYIENALKEGSCERRVTMKMMVVVDEIFSNIVHYSGAEEIMIRVDADKSNVILEFQDDGRRFNPLMQEEPDVSLGLEERKSGGLGVYLVKKLADQVIYQYMDGKNILTIKKIC